MTARQFTQLLGVLVVLFGCVTYGLLGVGTGDQFIVSMALGVGLIGLSGLLRKC